MKYHINSSWYKTFTYLIVQSNKILSKCFGSLYASFVELWFRLLRFSVKLSSIDKRLELLPEMPDAAFLMTSIKKERRERVLISSHCIEIYIRGFHNAALFAQCKVAFYHLGMPVTTPEATITTDNGRV